MQEKTICELEEIYPYLSVYLDDFEFKFAKEMTFEENLAQQPEAFFEQRKMTFDEVVKEFNGYIAKASEILEEAVEEVNSITIFPGQGKDKKKENFREISVKKGEVIAIVGETGSGKSRLLEDIEWQAQRDTPTKREVLINGKTKSMRTGGTGQQRLIAQLSQNMNFVLDMNVGEFLAMHAECFVQKGEIESIVQKVFDSAIDLAGESFSMETSVTGLSGGQSRALMIADCAFISKAPIVLIDEIENAGIDRRRAMELLVDRNKIVFIATHDPVLALAADKRIVIKNGAVDKILIRNEEERSALAEAEKLDRKLLQLRNRIRTGEVILNV